MKKIYNNLNIENLVKTNWFNQFDEMQKFEIETGIRSKVDVFKYAKKEFDVNQMRIIRMGLEANLDTDTINLLKSNKISRIYITFLHLYFK